MALEGLAEKNLKVKLRGRPGGKATWPARQPTTKLDEENQKREKGRRRRRRRRKLAVEAKERGDGGRSRRARARGGVAERPPERGVSFSFLSLSLCCCLFFSSLFASRSTLHLCDSAGEQEEPSRPAGSKLLAGPREERTRERERERERRHTDRPSFSLHCGRFSRSTLSGR